MRQQLCSNSLGSTIAGAAALFVSGILSFGSLQTFTWESYGCGCSKRPLDAAAARVSFYRWVAQSCSGLRSRDGSCKVQAGTIAWGACSSLMSKLAVGQHFLQGRLATITKFQTIVVSSIHYLTDRPCRLDSTTYRYLHCMVPRRICGY